MERVVYEIMAAVAGGMAWQEAFEKFIPQRKGHRVKEEEKAKKENNDDKQAPIEQNPDEKPQESETSTEDK